MFSASLQRLVLVGFAGSMAWACMAWAADDKPAPAAPAAAAPAPAAPAAVSDPDLPALLQEAGLAFSQPDKAKPIYRVTVEVGSDVFVVVCQVITESWKYADGSPAKAINLFVQLTPSYTQDIEVPPKLLRTMVETGNTQWFGGYALDANATTGQWSLYVQHAVFLRTLTAPTFSDYLTLLGWAAADGKKKFLPLIKS